MTRTDDDTWGVADGVGATALGSAEWRAREVGVTDPLFDDPYASLLVDTAVARGMWFRQFPPSMMARLDVTDPPLARGIRAQQAYTACRTRWFDDFFAGADVRQVVILAAGLDARAWRTPWPEGVALFEIDQPKVLAYKGEALHGAGHRPRARYTAVPTDLRTDWPKALCDSGFEPREPTAWSAEGLLVYLPSAAQDELFGRIDELSAPGSRVATDVFGAEFFDPAHLARLSGWFDRIRAAMAADGGNSPDAARMWFDENRTDVQHWLAAHGWTLDDVVGVHDLMDRYGRGVRQEDSGGVPRCHFVAGRKS